MRISAAIVMCSIVMTLVGCDQKKKVETGTSTSQGKKAPAIPVEAEYFPTGELKMAGKVTNGARQGPWASWYQNGSKNSEAIYNKGKMEGPYKVWYESGQTRIEGQFREDKEVGTWYFYGEKGDTLLVKNYDLPEQDSGI